MKHLQTDTWRQLCAGQLDDKQAEYWASHLEAGCEQCEALIADFSQQGETDPLDGFVDEVLLAEELSKHRTPPQEDQLGFARLQKTLQKRRWSRRLAVMGSLAAAFTGLVIFWPSLSANAPQKTTTWRTKGAHSSLSGDLQILLVRNDKLSIVTPASHVVVGDKLVFHFNLPQDACVQLMLQRGTTSQALLDDFKCLKAGQHSLENQGQALAYQLEQAGRISFYLQFTDPQGARGESPHIQMKVGEKASDRLP